MAIDPREQLNRYLPLTPARAELFVEEWESYVLSCIHRMRIMDPEDILYSVFYRALNALPDFRGDSKLSSWLYKISLRECLRFIEKQNRTADIVTSITDEHEPPHPDESVLEVLERQETAEQVQQALSKLSVKDREILALRYMEELTTTELAQRLDIPIGTVKARIHRSLARLKVLLEKPHDK